MSKIIRGDFEVIREKNWNKPYLCGMVLLRYKELDIAEHIQTRNGKKYKEMAEVVNKIQKMNLLKTYICFTAYSVISGVGELNLDRTSQRVKNEPVFSPEPTDRPYPDCPYLLLDVRDRDQYDCCHIIGGRCQEHQMTSSSCQESYCCFNHLSTLQRTVSPLPCYLGQWTPTPKKCWNTYPSMHVTFPCAVF